MADEANVANVANVADVANVARRLFRRKPLTSSVSVSLRWSPCRLDADIFC